MRDPESTGGHPAAPDDEGDIEYGDTAPGDGVAEGQDEDRPTTKSEPGDE